MLETLVVTLREGMEAALVVGIILAYLAKTQRLALKRYVYMGIVLALVGSVLAAAAIMAIAGGKESELMEGTLYFVAAIFIATMLIWMHSTNKRIRGDVEAGVENAFTRSQALGLVTFTFLMIFRRGLRWSSSSPPRPGNWVLRAWWAAFWVWALRSRSTTSLRKGV